MIIDEKKILEPISEELPVGRDLRENLNFDSQYYQIKDARNLARDLERQAIMGEEAEPAHPIWKKVFALCLETLQSTSKDVEVAAWLIEAAIREHGLMGLQQSLSLMGRLFQRYQLELHPKPQGSEDLRVMALYRLNGEDYEGTLIYPISQLPITAETSAGYFHSWQYISAVENSKITDKKIIEKKRSAGNSFLDDIEKAAKHSGKNFYQKYYQDLRATRETLTLLESTLARCFEESQVPSLKQVDSALETLQDHLRFIVKSCNFSIELDNPMQNKEERSEKITKKSSKFKSSMMPISLVEGGPIEDRQSALQLLQEVADFFRKTEPQSPLPYLLDQTIRLGKMSFPELLKVLVNDAKAYGAVYQMLGINSDNPFN